MSQAIALLALWDRGQLTFVLVSPCICNEHRNLLSLFFFSLNYGSLFKIRKRSKLRWTCNKDSVLTLTYLILLKFYWYLLLLINHQINAECLLSANGLQSALPVVPLVLRFAWTAWGCPLLTLVLSVLAVGIQCLFSPNPSPTITLNFISPQVLSYLPEWTMSLKFYRLKSNLSIINLLAAWT